MDASSWGGIRDWKAKGTHESGTVMQGTAESEESRLSRLALRRYAELRRRRYAKEFCFRQLGDLNGRRVLDAGCGDGGNLVNFAVQGAQVTGLDPSPAAAERAARLVTLNQLQDRVTVSCAALPDADLPFASFDVLWLDFVLHRHQDDISRYLAAGVRLIRPGGIMMIMEPMNFWPAYRRLRLRFRGGTPVPPDQQPLETDHLERAMALMEVPHVRAFRALARLDRVLIGPTPYEIAPPVRRGAMDVVAGIDYAMLSLAPLRRLASVVVTWGTPRSAARAGNPGMEHGA